MLLALKSGGNHAEKTPPESHPSIQIESRAGGGQRRQDSRGAGAIVRCSRRSEAGFCQGHVLLRRRLR